MRARAKYRTALAAGLATWCGVLGLALSCGSAAVHPQVSSDSGTDSLKEPDVDSATKDSGPQEATPGEGDSSCAAATAIGQGGTFSGNTCDGTTLSVSGCVGGVKAVVFEISPTTSGQNLTFYVSKGFTLVGALSESCSFQATSCDGGGVGGLEESAGVGSFLAVFQDDGTCGPFSLAVYNASYCATPADASTCTCGNIPACPPGQVCRVGSNLQVSIRQPVPPSGAAAPRRRRAAATPRRPSRTPVPPSRPRA